jgi:hypothetical protein
MDLCYLRTLYQLHPLLHIKYYERMIAFREIETIWKEAVVAYVNVRSIPLFAWETKGSNKEPQ